MSLSGRVLSRTNFGHLEAHDEQLVRLGMLAERYFADDPNTALLKLRQLAELLAQLVAAKVGLYTSRDEAQYDLLRRLQDQGILPREVAQLFGEVRRAGNAANHAILGDHRTALAMLKISWQLGIWFHRTFGNAAFESGVLFLRRHRKTRAKSCAPSWQRLARRSLSTRPRTTTRPN